MRFFSYLILTALLVVFINPLFPYWIIMIILGVLGFILNPGNGAAFFGTGLGMGLVWIGQSIYLSINTGSPLPEQMADLMQVGRGTNLILATGILGFLLGGLSGLSGRLLRTMLKRKPDNIYKGTTW